MRASIVFHRAQQDQDKLDIAKDRLGKDAWLASERSERTGNLSSEDKMKYEKSVSELPRQIKEQYEAALRLYETVCTVCRAPALD